VWERLSENVLAMMGLGALIVMVLIAAFAPVIAPYGRDEISYDLTAPPSREHILGTDSVGRDELTRLIYAARISLSVGLAVSLVTVIIGSLVGAAAGFYGGRVDALLSGLVNVLLSIPIIPLAMVLGAFVKTNLLFVVLVLGALSWVGVARIIRAEFMSLKEREFALAARAIGASNWHIVFRHIFPNAFASIIVAATLQVAAGILAESALSYLGYGIQPPTPSWGNMLQNAQRFFRTDPRLAIYPGLLISLAVMSINVLGDGLRDALDPRLRQP
jgi:peptide/nickel transport system permease protein